MKSAISLHNESPRWSDIVFGDQDTCRYQTIYIYRDVVSIGPLEIPSQHTLNGKVIMCKDDKLCPKKSWNHNNSAMYPCITMWKQVVSDFVTRQKSMPYIWQCGRDMLSPFYISFFVFWFFFVIFFLMLWRIGAEASKNLFLIAKSRDRNLRRLIELSNL